MLSLNNISIYQFKNYSEQNFQFSNRIVAICGANGSGKTNLLDAVYFLCFTKSYFNRQDAQVVQQNKLGLRVSGWFNKKNDALTVTGIIRENSKKEFLWNDDEYKKFSEHIGKLPCVMIAPDDISFINGTSEERRKFIDTILSQINPQYLQQLIDYNKILLQRNSLLKKINEGENIDEILLETLDEQLSQKAEFIFTERKLLLQELIPLIKVSYNNIAQRSDGIEIEYESQLHNNSFKELLRQNRRKDIALQRTTCGIHKDDLIILMNTHFFKQTASQGQKKSLLFSFKLAEFEILEKNKNFAPILLLDDVFEKLDEQRMHHLLKKVCLEKNAQVFITDTHAARLEKTLKELNVLYDLIHLSN